MKFAPSRRDVLRLAGAAVLAGCGDNELTRPPNGSHAVAIVEPEPNSFLVTVWSPIVRSIAIEVRAGDDIVYAGRGQLDAAQHVVVEIDGLVPSTSYQVTVTSDDAVVLGPHQVRTAPAPDDSRPVRLAVSADLDPSPEFESDLLEHLAAVDPEVYVSIGDFPYTDNGPPAATIAEYRARHAELRTEPRVRTWMQAMAIRAIYDDHEFRNDWDAARAAAEPARFAAAMQVWDEFFPLRVIDGGIRYRRWTWGRLVECFLLDCRRFRSANDAPDDLHKTMLGAVQLAWLIDAVTHSTATWKLVFTSVPLDFGTGDDHWASFKTERQQLFDALRVASTSGVLFVSGDQHFFAAHRHAYGLREFQVGPLSRGLGTPGPVASGVLFRDVRYNFGLIDVDGDRLTFSGVGPGGEVFYKETLSAADVTPV